MQELVDATINISIEEIEYSGSIPLQLADPARRRLWIEKFLLFLLKKPEGISEISIHPWSSRVIVGLTLFRVLNLRYRCNSEASLNHREIWAVNYMSDTSVHLSLSDVNAMRRGMSHNVASSRLFGFTKETPWDSTVS